MKKPAITRRKFLGRAAEAGIAGIMIPGITGGDLVEQETAPGVPGEKEKGWFDRFPVGEECDVVVCGGGPSGFTAAIAAAREGAEVLLIERYGFPGGMLTAGFVQPIYGFFSRHIQVVRGIAQEFIEELSKTEGATSGHRYRDECVEKRKKSGECITGIDEKNCTVACVSNVCSVDSDMARVVMAEMLEKAAVKMLFHTTVVAVNKENSGIYEILVSNKSGFRRIRSKIYIDATGDADVSALAGVEYETGENGKVKPPSLMFKISGVKHDKDRIKVLFSDESTGKQAGAWLMKLPGKGRYTVNAPSGLEEFDPTDSRKLSRGQVQATSRALKLFLWMKKNVDFLSDIELISFAPQIGIRDSRRIKGVYTLSDEDVLNSAKFPKSGIANGVHPVDLHVKTEKSGGANLIVLPCGDYYQIPYETMLPGGVNNLIVTGRSISSTFMAQGSLRVMATCMMLGEAAGIASGLCIKQGRKPREIEPAAVRNIMIARGACLGEENAIPAWNRGNAPLPPEISSKAYPENGK